jgi:hypothetical protein
MSYTDKLLSAQKLGSVLSYIQTLKQCNVDVSKLQQSVNAENMKNISALDTKSNKQQAQIDEIVTIAGRNTLKLFLKNEMSFKNIESIRFV